MYPTVDLMRMLYAPRNGKIRPATLAAAFLIFALAAGCSMIERGPSPSSLTYSDFETRTLDNPHLKEFIESCLHYNISPWPPTRWDRTMLTLAAYYYHPHHGGRKLSRWNQDDEREQEG